MKKEKLQVMTDEAAQRLYISAMLGNPALFARVQHLVKPTYFDGGLQNGVAFIKKFFQDQKGVPSQSVFQAGSKLNIEAVPLPPQDCSFIAEELANFCQIRAITEAVLKAPGFIEAGDFGKMVEEIKEATQVQLHTDLGIEYFENPEARLILTEDQQELIPTKWNTVDDLIGGGIGRQELILFAAPSGVGKSIAMLNLAHNLLSQGLHGVYISLEMRDLVVASRLDSMISRIASGSIRTNKTFVSQEVENFKETSRGRLFIKRMREGTTTAAHISSYLKELETVHGFKPDFVVVDYLDLMASVQKHDGSNMFTKDKLVSEELRGIGFDYNCIMISASQLGRQAHIAAREEKSMSQDMIQGGISKINTSDLVIALVKDEAMEAAGEYRFDFIKSRNSNAVNKHLKMSWDANSLRISDFGVKLKTMKKAPLVNGLNDVVPGKNSDGLAALLKL